MLGSSLSQAWPPFVLVAALLVIGAVAHRDGMFSRLGAMLETLPGPPWVLFAAACVLLAITTALLNLDTAVVFVTPVIVHAARRRGIPAAAFVYAALFMVNASSLYLPGSNLTNLLVLAEQPHARSFAAGMLAPGLGAGLVTALGLALFHRRGLAGGEPRGEREAVSGSLLGVGAAAALAAAVLMVIFPNPALPVAGVALLCALAALAGWTRGGADAATTSPDAAGAVATSPATATATATATDADADAGSGTPRDRITVAELVRAASPQVLAAIFAVAVGLGVLARAWDGPQHLLAHADRPETTAIAALASVLVNNLPAAVMLSAHAVPHPRALLFGLNLGPNLAVTGSLAAFLWIRTADQLGAETSVARVSRLGIVLAPLAMLVALAVSTG